MRSLLALSALALAACTPSLGECDENAGRRVAFLTIDGEDAAGRSGEPAFEGQALLTVSCGNGAFCHSPSAIDGARYGVARTLDFDVRIACDDRAPTSGCDAESTERLRRQQLNTFDHRGSILDQVERGLMPPGPIGASIRAEAPRYVRNDGSPVPELDTPEGRDILRNWLACGAPVVERAQDEDEELAAGDYCGDERIGDCIVGLPRQIDPPEPRWQPIFERIIYPFCGETCHGPGDPDNRLEANLDLSTPEIAYAEMVGVVATGSFCSNTELAHVEPGDPGASLLIDKMRANTVCGERMPIGGPFLPELLLEAIEEWIRLGALDD